MLSLFKSKPAECRHEDDGSSEPDAAAREQRALSAYKRTLQTEGSEAEIEETISHQQTPPRSHRDDSVPAETPDSMLFISSDEEGSSTDEEDCFDEVEELREEVRQLRAAAEVGQLLAPLLDPSLGT